MDEPVDEPVQLYTDSKGTTWKRTGYCCKCGECCRGNPFTGEEHGYCPLLKALEDGTFNCTDRQHPYYLQGCNVWPQRPEQITDKPKCTYKFERMPDGG